MLFRSLDAFAFGPLYTLFDPFTSDPLMFLVGAVILGDSLTGRAPANYSKPQVGCTRCQLPLTRAKSRWGYASRYLEDRFCLITVPADLSAGYSFFHSATGGRNNDRVK